MLFSPVGGLRSKVKEWAGPRSRWGLRGRCAPSPSSCGHLSASPGLGTRPCRLCPWAHTAGTSSLWFLLSCPSQISLLLSHEDTCLSDLGLTQIIQDPLLTYPLHLQRPFCQVRFWE